MRTCSTLLVTAAIAVAAAITHASEPRVRLWHQSGAPAGWTVGARAAANVSITFTVALKQEGLDELDRLFWEVSDPNNVGYGQYLSGEEVQALTAASPATLRTATAFLSVENVSCSDAPRDALVCVGAVAAIEALFQTKFYTFTHKVTGATVARHLGEASLPADVAAVVEFVAGLAYFPSPSNKVKVNAPEAQGSYDDDPFVVDYHVIPETLRLFYGLNGISGSPASSQGVAEFQNVPGYVAADFQKFQAEVGEAISAPTIVGPFAPSPTSLESILDISYIGAVGKNNSNWYWTEKDWLWEFSLAFIAAKSRPAVLSMSYGWSEKQQCLIDTSCSSLGLDSTTYVIRVSQQFKKIGLLGTSLVAASGDSGAHGRTDMLCIPLIDDDAASGPGVPLDMNPAFPASSPYVTAVGATQIADGVSSGATSPVCSKIKCATGGREIVASTATGAEIVSGGGFSWLLPQPSYQAKVVAAYLTNASAVPAAEYFNASGRGYPDIASLGHKYYVQDDGIITSVDGTSCAAPVAGGVLGLLNAHRLANKQPVIGFANPLLYQIYAEDNTAFNDVVQGGNQCTEDGCFCPNGFNAAPGWDAASGLGTPNYPKILAAMKAIDARREARIAATAATAAK